MSASNVKQPFLNDWIILDTSRESYVNECLNDHTFPKEKKLFKYWPHAFNYDHGIPSYLISFMNGKEQIDAPTIVRDGLADLVPFLGIKSIKNLILPAPIKMHFGNKAHAYWESVVLHKPRAPRQVVITDMFSWYDSRDQSNFRKRLRYLSKVINTSYGKLPCLILRPFEWMVGSQQPFVLVLEEWIRSLANEVRLLNWEEFYYHIDHSRSVHISLLDTKIIEDSYIDWFIWSMGGSVYQEKSGNKLSVKDNFIPLSLNHGMKIIPGSRSGI